MKKILILSANPVNTSKLRLDSEVREVQCALERSRRREEFELIPRLAVRIDDGYLLLALELATAQVVSGQSWVTLLTDFQREIARLKTLDRPGATGISDDASLKKLSLTASFGNLVLGNHLTSHR